MFGTIVFQSAFQAEGETNPYSGVYGGLLISVVNIVSSSAAIAIVEKLPRKVMFFGSVGVDIVCLVVFVILYLVFPDAKS